MRDETVERLFSFFTSSDRAAAVVGDLVEEREKRGSIWFWRQVAGVGFALGRNATTEAPLRILALTMAGLMVLSAPIFGGVAAVFLFPEAADSLVGWIGLSFFWWGGAFWTGASLVTMAPRRGIVACALLAATVGALLIGFGGPAVWRDPSNTDLAIACATGLVALAPLLAGAALARRRIIGLSKAPGLPNEAQITA